MKSSMYLSYGSRSLLRGGQRTLLAIFCIAVGVMAIVSLQSVGLMIGNAFTGNVRDSNGGDIAVTAGATPFSKQDLSFFEGLKKNGVVTTYTSVTQANASVGTTISSNDQFIIEAVDTGSFPIVIPPRFKTPVDGSLSSLLTNGQVVVNQNFADRYALKVNDPVEIHIKMPGNAQTLHTRIAGIFTNSGVFSESSSIVVVSLNDYQAINPGQDVLYSQVYVNTANETKANAAKNAIQQHFALAKIQTVADGLKSAQQQVEIIQKFLNIAGLLALLVGGVGIVNTMQVLLSRRKIEIATLKTTGYRRTDLYLLFGTEAALLGLIGGVVGALVAIGVSILVRNIVQQLFPITLPFELNPIIISGGVVIGLVTALTFGLMPIVQAANIRPLNVIRETPEGRGASSILLTVVLLLVLSILFCGLATFILKDVLWGVAAVYGAFVFLAFLSLFFSLAVLLVSKLPVPERFSPGYLGLIVIGVGASSVLSLALPTFGNILLVLSLLGFVIVVLPKSWKANTKMALRNIGRQRARTTTTLLALFVGVFTIGLIMALGQNLSAEINKQLASSLSYNLVTFVQGDDIKALRTQQATIPGLSPSKTAQTSYAAIVPIAVDGTPIKSLITQKNAESVKGVISQMSSAEGFDIANNVLPDMRGAKLEGRSLGPEDRGMQHVMLQADIKKQEIFKNRLKLGSVLTFASQDGKQHTTVRIVGFYDPGTVNSHFAKILATQDVIRAITPPGKETFIFYMKVDNDKVGRALGQISKIAPNAYVLNLANIGDSIDRAISQILLVLVTVASLSLLAGVIIIANAVALAMLERRRELGILKAVGYTSHTILSGVLIENSIVGGLGALLAMLVVALSMNLIGTYYFKTSFGVNPLLTLAVIVGIAAVAMLTAAFIAWGAARVRPLEVLRYE